MRLLLATLFLAQLFFGSAFIIAHSKPSGRVINCDDAEAHEAAAVAVTHINSHHTTGYKYTLNQVEKIRAVPSNDNSESFFLELDLLETKCPSVSPTPLAQCPVRPVIEQAVEGDCDVRLSKINGTFAVLGTRCKSELDSAENLQRICPDCPMLASLNNSQVIHAVDVSLHKFNSGNNTVSYRLHEIGRGQIQGGISNTVSVEFIIAASNCSIEDANAGVVACVEETGASAHYGACSGTVVKHHDAVDEDVAVQCTIYEPQIKTGAQAGEQHVPHVPLAPTKPNVPHSHFHHSLYFSSESESAEHHFLVSPKKQAVKRSLTGEPVLPSLPANVPICPGKKIHF
ncbi:alpha-2-HS-glycoprotein [Pseudophryne corroboree]|uniref:alpha-2-HS-glycoprotein n=1 Tax=Pseudophryne corroboree TaxID=495146 RepID=UPI0030814D0F